MDRSAATGVARSEANPVSDIPAVDVGDLPPRETRQDLIAQIAPVHIERCRLPEPFVAPEHGFGDGLEDGLAGIAGHLPAAPDRCEYPGGAGPGLADIHCCGVADDLPDALSVMLAVDEESFAARGQDADAEAPELDVADVVGGLARAEHPDPGVGEDELGHEHSPDCGCSRGRAGCPIRSAATMNQEKKRPFVI